MLLKAKIILSNTFGGGKCQHWQTIFRDLRSWFDRNLTHLGIVSNLRRGSREVILNYSNTKSTLKKNNFLPQQNWFYYQENWANFEYTHTLSKNIMICTFLSKIWNYNTLTIRCIMLVPTKKKSFLNYTAFSE